MYKVHYNTTEISSLRIVRTDSPSGKLLKTLLFVDFFFYGRKTFPSIFIPGDHSKELLVNEVMDLDD